MSSRNIFLLVTYVTLLYTKISKERFKNVLKKCDYGVMMIISGELVKPIGETSNLTKNKSIGIIGMGRIGESLLTDLVRESKRLKLENLIVYSRPNVEKECNRI